MANETFQFYSIVPFDVKDPVVLTKTMPVTAGYRYTIYSRGGSADYSGETNVEIWFGNDLLFSTYGAESDEVYINCDGDGVKQLTIKLINNSLYNATLGAFIVYSYGPIFTN